MLRSVQFGGLLILGPLEKPLEIADYVFYCIKNGSERNSEHFNLPRNGSEQNYLVLSVFLRAFVYLPRNGLERNCSAKQRNSDGMNQNFRLFRVPRNNVSLPV
jgi:hypothetical protein